MYLNARDLVPVEPEYLQRGEGGEALYPRDGVGVEVEPPQTSAGGHTLHALHTHTHTHTARSCECTIIIMYIHYHKRRCMFRPFTLGCSREHRERGGGRVHQALP